MNAHTTSKRNIGDYLLEFYEQYKAVTHALQDRSGKRSEDREIFVPKGLYRLLHNRLRLDGQPVRALVKTVLCYGRR